MECDNDIYEEVDAVENVYEGDTKRNSDLKKTPVGISKFKSSIVEKHSKKKITLILVFSILLLLLVAVAAGTTYAVYDIFKLKSGSASSELQQNVAFSSMLENIRMNVSLEVIKHQQLMRDLEARIQQLSNFTAEMIEALDARIAQVQNTSHDNIVQQNSELRDLTSSFNVTIAQVQNSSRDIARQNNELRDLASSFNVAHQHLNDSILVLNSIVGQPLTSCSTLPQSFPAGNYDFVSANGAHVRQYCPPVSTRCGLRGRWHSAASLDMTNIFHQCFSNLTQHTYSNRRLCVRSSNSSGCSSVQLSTTTAYRSICGQVRAYQFGSPDAFHFSSSIDSPYVEGVSITHGNPRQHIWTFAATRNEHSNRNGCPCMDEGSDVRPAFVKNNYFCDTGTSTGTGAVFYGSDPLWDGAGCGSTNDCCSFNGPPWFYTKLSQYTYDDVELRLCSDHVRSEEDIALERVEIYVK